MDYFFEIPVYRCTEDKYHDELEKEKLNLFEECGRSLDDPPNSIRSLLAYYDKNIWEPWYYNQVIGWLRLFVLDCQIRCDYYKLSNKRLLRKMKNKKFLYHDSFLLMAFDSNQSSIEFFDDLLNSLQDLAKQKQFKGRFMDLQAFTRAAPHIDWLAFMAKK